MSSPTLKRSDWQTQARGCQHSILIGPWWIGWETCLILFFRLVPTVIDLQQHWNQYRSALFHSIGSQHTFCYDKRSTPQYHTTDVLPLSDLSGLKCFNRVSYCVCRHVKKNELSKFCVWKAGGRCDIQPHYSTFGSLFLQRCKITPIWPPVVWSVWQRRWSLNNTNTDS